MKLKVNVSHSVHNDLNSCTMQNSIVSIDGEDDCTFSVCGDSGHIYYLQGKKLCFCLQ